MLGEAWAALALKVFSYLTDEAGLARFKKQQAIARLQREIKDDIRCKNFVGASTKLLELQRLSNEP